MIFTYDREVLLKLSFQCSHNVPCVSFDFWLLKFLSIQRAYQYFIVLRVSESIEAFFAKCIPTIQRDRLLVEEIELAIAFAAGVEEVELFHISKL